MSPDDLKPDDDPREAELAARGRMLVAAAVAETHAPLALRERIEAERERQAKPRSRGRWLPFAGLATAVAAVLVAIVVATGGGGGGGPTVLAVASVSLHGPTRPAPEQDKTNPKVLRAGVEGVKFPYWGDSFEWEASGARNDRVGGRHTETVYYRSPKGPAAAYTIVAGDALSVPSGARIVKAKGVVFHVSRTGRAQVLTWLREGHTCVMTASRAVPTAKLLQLAAWHGQGAVTF